MAVDINGDGLIALGGTSTTQGRLRLAEDTDNGTNYIELTAPASVASNRTITFPDVTGTVLTNASAGTVLQVVQAYKTDTASTTTLVSTSWTDITGLSVSITPTASSSKILVIASCAVSTSSTSFGYIRLMRGATALFIGDAAGNRPPISGMSFNGGYNEGVLVSIPISYLDSPSTTSSTTYKLQLATGVAGATVYVNRSFRDTNTIDYDPRQASSIILMEIAG